MADDIHNLCPVAAYEAVPTIAAENAAAETGANEKALPTKNSQSKPHQKSTKGTKGKQKTKQRARKSGESDNRFTSPQMIRAVEESFGRISFDPCWHEASAVKPVAYLDFRKGQDGLTHPWQGPVAFVNPPWSAAKKFLERCYDQWKRGYADKIICLVPSKTDTSFFHTVLKAEADVYFVERRMRFFKVDGTSYTSAESVMIVIFGATEMDKVRFEARVPGSWWLPSKKDSLASGLPMRGRLPLRPANDPFSCAPAARLDGRSDVVLCNRFRAAT